MNYIKATISFCVIVLFLSSVASASINTDMKKFDSANEKDFVKLDKQAAIDFKTISAQKNVNILVISNSANFENCNLVFSYKVLNSKDVEIKDAKERVSIVSFNELSKYSNHFFTGKAVKTLDTSGSLSDNTELVKVVKANHNPIFDVKVDTDFSKKSIASEFKLVSKEIKNNNYWKPLLISDSANFETNNQYVGYHIVNSKEIRIYEETGENETTTFDKLARYECHFFNKVPKSIDTSGSLSANLDEMRVTQKVSDLKEKTTTKEKKVVKENYKKSSEYKEFLAWKKSRGN